MSYREMAEVDAAMQAANSAWVRAGIRGTPWTRHLRESLRAALEATERYAVVR